MNEVAVSRAFLFEVARIYFMAFLSYAFSHISGGAALEENWHHHAIAHELDLIAKGKSQRLIINMPPRNLKSITVTVAWVTFMLGVDPTLNFVCVSYSDDLSAKHARDRLAIMESWWYKLIFPKTRLSRIAAKDFETTAGGGCMATSITGTFTGRGGDIIVIDDPHKPEEALSPTTRANVERWYRSTLLSRLNNKQTGAIILIMQRLHEQDLAGIVLAEGGWRVLSLRAIATEDSVHRLPLGRVHQRKVNDVLHPERESLEVLRRLEAGMGTADYSAQYQQMPVPRSGNLIKREWLHYYDDVIVPESGDLIVQSWDTASKDGIHNDFSACLTAVIRKKRVYLIDAFRAKLTIPALAEEVNRRALAFKAEVLLIEDAASGTFLLQLLRATRLDGVPYPYARDATTDKASRMMGQTPFMAGGQFLMPRNAPWLGALEHELLAFPHGGHDDQVDALAHLLGWFRVTLLQHGPDVPPIEGSSSYNWGDDDDDDLDNRPVELGGD